MNHSSLPNLLRALTAEPLVIERRTLDAFVGVLRRRSLEGVSFNGAELHAELEIAAPRPATSQSSAKRQVQVIPIVGTIMNRAQSMGLGAMEIGQMVDRAALDPRVDAIVLDVDSPGGTVMGVPELADKVFRARGEKPVIAVANGLMASAAYWVSAAADEVVVAPSGEVGSIGVIAFHEDWSQWLENEGIAVTELAAGKYKTEGAPWKSLDADAEVFFRERVSEVYDWFISDVARFRGDNVKAVRAGYGEGRVLSADAAVAANLADRVGTLEGEIARLIEEPAEKRGMRARLANRAETQRRLTARRV